MRSGLYLPYRRESWAALGRRSLHRAVPGRRPSQTSNTRPEVGNRPHCKHFSSRRRFLPPGPTRTSSGGLADLLLLTSTCRTAPRAASATTDSYFWHQVNRRTDAHGECRRVLPDASWSTSSRAAVRSGRGGQDICPDKIDGTPAGRLTDRRSDPDRGLERHHALCGVARIFPRTGACSPISHSGYVVFPRLTRDMNRRGRFPMRRLRRTGDAFLLNARATCSGLDLQKAPRQTSAVRLVLPSAAYASCTLSTRTLSPRARALSPTSPPSRNVRDHGFGLRGRNVAPRPLGDRIPSTPDCRGHRLEADCTSASPPSDRPEPSSAFWACLLRCSRRSDCVITWVTRPALFERCAARLVVPNPSSPGAARDRTSLPHLLGPSNSLGFRSGGRRSRC